ncbi:MAG: hypothetical protein QN193_07895 [Armatimonadota bacterium]|nr:hypothetical protein [Armatimonadota bacterium]MDR7444239.1 hypothetical protein [Armatimonadota bacterium]MDR7570514.1 hypothetical protein [Armatimonadota bacterium]MDR7614227.1 hypothetical protein [Armatimonadota bacterium]
MGRLWRVGAVAWMALVGTLGLLPEEVNPGLPLSGAPSHLVALLVLVVLLRRWPLSACGAAAAAWAYGVGIEGLQGLVGWRTVELGDVAANAAGILLGLLLDLLVRAGRR